MRGVLFGSLMMLSMSTLFGCGGGDSSGGPPTPGGGGSSAQEGVPDEELQPEVGTCQPLCCSNADCGTGKTCTPFESPSGTLGICSNGYDAATAANPTAGPTTPLTCWKLNESECNALTGEGCGAGDSCDFSAGAADVESVVSCFGGENTGAEGESCDNALGPWCQPGFHCVTQ
jgi:hypothetical protein